MTEDKTFSSPIKGIGTLGSKLLKEHAGIHGRTIVANILLLAKLSHRPNINGISYKMNLKMKKKIKECLWGGETEEQEYFGRY